MGKNVSFLKNVQQHMTDAHPLSEQFKQIH